MTTITIWYFVMIGFGSIPMQSKDACMEANKEMRINNGFCINTQTGEVVK